MDIKKKKIVLMQSYYVIFLALFSLSANALLAQSNCKKSSKPQIKIHVTKETDEYGNIIKYDSVYTYSWNDDHVHFINPDSVLKRIEKAFMNDTFKNEFGNIHINLPKIQASMKSVDPSIINNFFKEHFSKVDSCYLGNSFREFLEFDAFENLEDIIDEQKKMMNEFKKYYHTPCSKDTLETNSKNKHKKPDYTHDTYNVIDI